MERYPTDRKIRRTIERHNERVAEAALDVLMSLPQSEQAEQVRSLLAPLGWSETRQVTSVGDGLWLLGTVVVGVSALPAAALLVTSGDELTGTRLDTFLEGLDPEVRVVHLLCMGAASQDGRDAASALWPLVLIHDRDSVRRLVTDSRTLVHEVTVPPVLLVSELGKGAERARSTSEGQAADSRGTAARLFRWRLEQLDGDRYALHGEYIPDPSQSFVLERELVPPGGDFVPARRELHQAICDHLTCIFPDLPADRIRTKAWAGVHKVYRAKVYGNQ